MNKHPCLNCEHFKIAKSGKSYNCKHPKITENDTYQYGRGFTCTCTPKWCPQHPNRDYLGQKVKVPEGQRRETKIVVTMNVRELLHFFNVRGCNRAQWEIMELAYQMWLLCLDVAPNLFKNAGPSCLNWKCPEGAMSCGKSEEARNKWSS